MKLWICFPLLTGKTISCWTVG